MRYALCVAYYELNVFIKNNGNSLIIFHPKYYDAFLTVNVIMIIRFIS
jgi:hypothetical protein